MLHTRTLVFWPGAARARSIRERRSAYAAELARFFGCELKFGAAVDEVLFPGRLRDLHLLNSDPHLNRLLVRYCVETLAHRKGSPDSMRTRVENAIVAMLPHGNARASHIAQGLGVSQRSLVRHFGQECLTFSKVLAALRLSLAKKYLTEERSLALQRSMAARLSGHRGFLICIQTMDWKKTIRG